MRGKTHPPYDPEFRKRAVQLVITQGLSLKLNTLIIESRL